MSISFCIRLPFFFFNDTATTEIYTLSLHDALPISGAAGARVLRGSSATRDGACRASSQPPACAPTIRARSEEHTSELQSLAYLVCRLLLEKKKKNKDTRSEIHQQQACHTAQHQISA